jgi:Tfp pilus assembly protein PilE
MGQQQLLLIVLGVIIVGIAVVVGINVFTASAASANRDAITADLTNLAAMAQQFYRKPVALGGGGNAFDASKGAAAAWAPPASLSPTANMSAAVTPTVGAQTITLVAVGTETGTDGAAKVKVTMVVSPTVITSTTVNN